MLQGNRKQSKVKQSCHFVAMQQKQHMLTVLVIQFHLRPFKSLPTWEKSQLIIVHRYLTWTSRVMGPLLSTSKISPFLVPTRMWPWPRDMARMEGLSSKSNPVECMIYSMRSETLAWARTWEDIFIISAKSAECIKWICIERIQGQWRAIENRMTFLPLEPGARTARLMA